MKRPLTVSISSAALVLAGFWWAYQSYPSIQARAPLPSQLSRADGQPAAPRSTAPSLKTSAQRALRYAVEFHTELMPSESETKGQGQGLLIGFSAILTISPVQDEAHVRWLQLVLSELTPLVDSQGRNWLEGVEREYLSQGLSQPIYLGLAADGRADKLTLTRPSDALIEGILRLVAESSQFVTGTGTSYDTQELDPVGEALVSYRRLAEQRYQKRKVKYLRLLTSEGLSTPEQAGLVVDVTGETAVMRDPTNTHTLALELVEDTRTKLGDATLTNHVELDLRLIDAVSNAAAVQAFRAHKRLAGVDLRRLPAAHELDAERTLRELVRDKSAQDLLVDARSVSSEDTARRRHLLAQLEASLVLDPAGAAVLSASFREADDREASLVLSALGNAGTGEAQRVLGSLASDSKIEGGRRESALALLGMTREPTLETVATLREASADAEDPHHRTAMLALGNLQQRLADNDESDRVFDELVQKLRQAPSDDARMLCLAALGNTGDARLTAIARPFAVQGSAGVRAEAFWALRLIGDEQALALLSQGVTADLANAVRQRAIEALRYRPSAEATKLLTVAASSDPDGEVRLSALMVLSSLGEPALRELARTIAKRDPNDAVREQAARMLAEG